MGEGRRRSALAAITLTVGAVAAALAASCGGSSSSNSSSHCVPGVSMTCGGQGGCVGFQTCKSDGSGYAPCDCSVGEAGTSSGGTSDAASSSSGVASSGAGPGDSGMDSGARDALAADGAADGGAWSPSNLPGLAVWLNGDVGVIRASSAQVTRWQDQSGNGLDFVPYGASCDGGSCSCINSPCFSPGAAKGHGEVTCPAGSALALAQGVTGAPLDFGTGDFAIAEVFMAYALLNELWAQPGGLYVNVDNSGNDAFNINGVGGVLIPGMNGWHALTARGAAMDLLTDWGQSATGPTNASAVLTTAYAGPDSGSPVVAICVNAGVAEVVAVKGKLSDANRTSLMAYLKTKYSL